MYFIWRLSQVLFLNLIFLRHHRALKCNYVENIANNSISNDSLGRFIKKHIENEKRADMIECHCSDIAEVALSNQIPNYSFELSII